MKSNQKKSKMRRFSRVKLPGDEDLKFYIQMAFILGFSWITGFIMTTFLKYYESIEILNNIFIYLFILSNALIGVFIFFAFIFKRDVRMLYVKLYRQKTSKYFSRENSSTISSSQNNISYIKNRNTTSSHVRVSECSTSPLSLSVSNLKINQEDKNRNSSNGISPNQAIASKASVKTYVKIFPNIFASNKLTHENVDNVIKSKLNEIKNKQKANLKYSDSSAYNDDVFY